MHIPVRVSSEKADDEMLKKINRHTLEPVTLDDVFTFSGICSNDRMDSYLTRMDPTTTLKNYAEDLRNGVPLLPGHDITKNPYGRSYDGEFIQAEADESNQVRGHWYILNNTNLNGENTGDTIRAIKAGILKDMSVGFGNPNMWYRCSSCGRDVMNFDCPHLPGMEDEEGRVTFAWVVEGRLREVSTVYKGATPGSWIDKAREYVNQGQIPQMNIQRLEREYQVRLDDGKRSFYMPKNNETKEDEGMSQTARNSLLDDIRNAVRENKVEKGKIYDILTEEGEPFRQPDDVALRNELGRDYTSVGAVRTLKREAQQGRRYLADVVDAAVASRVRAQGDTFNSESYRAMLNNSADIDAIKEEIRAYEKMAEQRFTGGRQTEDETPEDKKEPEHKTQDEEKNERVDNFSLNIFEKGDE